MITNLWSSAPARDLTGIVGETNFRSLCNLAMGTLHSAVLNVAEENTWSGRGLRGLLPMDSTNCCARSASGELDARPAGVAVGAWGTDI